ncbi:unnamed protein product [Calypogeia fissa]
MTKDWVPVREGSRSDCQFAKKGDIGLEEKRRYDETRKGRDEERKEWRGVERAGGGWKRVKHWNRGGGPRRSNGRGKGGKLS